LRHLLSTSLLSRLMVAGLCMVGPACASGPQKAPPVISAIPEAPIQVEKAPPIAAASADTPVQIEYERVDGQSCLQPKVITGVPDDSDFVAAEKRWMERTYPSYSLSYQSYFLGTEPKPGTREASHPSRPAVDRIDFVTAEGHAMSLCFMLGVASPTGLQ
jgi:hypothetical protein